MSLMSARSSVLSSQELEIPRTAVSPGLQWLWQHLGDVASPHILDCGVVRRVTVDTLLHRNARLYMADLVSALQAGRRYWDYSRGTPVFLTDPFLAQLPPIPRGSLNVVLCWQLLDLLPQEARSELVRRMYLYLQPDGVLFCLLREPHLTRGLETVWWLDELTTLGREFGGRAPYSYSAISNREMERLIPYGSVKTFLTRSGVREVLALK